MLFAFFHLKLDIFLSLQFFLISDIFTSDIFIEGLWHEDKYQKVFILRRLVNYLRSYRKIFLVRLWSKILVHYRFNFLISLGDFIVRDCDHQLSFKRNENSTKCDYGMFL